MTEEKREAAGWNLDNSYARLPAMFFTNQRPAPVKKPELAVFNDALAESLGLSGKDLRNPEGVPVLAGNDIPPGSSPLAQAYAGHQFGYFAILGDGRAVLLGEQITPEGKRFDIQLKGSGRTPYSRQGDGRAALGPMLREYVISEAMHGLGIPTSRSLAVVTTGEPVMRETVLPGAVLTRVAASHLRVGTFQYAAQRGSIAELKALADYAWERHYRDCDAGDNRYVALLQEVMERQARLIAKWQLAGFIHGVMNTDNMAISGETIDYGPCAFMDTYNPATVFSSIDVQGRYAYGRQPVIAGWNLARLAEALLPLLHDDENKAVNRANEMLEGFSARYLRHWLAGMRAKLGLTGEEARDESLIEDLFSMMIKYNADYTNTFRALTLEKVDETGLAGTPEYLAWDKRRQDRLGRQKESRAEIQELMRRSNPAVIPRNHRVEEALAKANQGDLQEIYRLLAVLSDPYTYSPEQEEYAAPPVPSSHPYRTFCGT